MEIDMPTPQIDRAGTKITIISNGDIFKSQCEALVNPVNTKGVMGKGLALAFKNKYPAHFENYQRACQSGEMTTEKVLAYQEINGPMIICLATKADWRDSSKIEYVSAGLDDLANQIKALGIRSVAIPKLGCGLGGLDWNKVRPLIVEKMSSIDSINVKIYE
jgi:Predicted phosphatase homologous to the C-terminal domain of histone macroH2A1